MRSVSLKTNYQDSFITTMLSIDELETHSCEVASSRLAPRELE